MSFAASAAAFQWTW